MGKHYRTTPNDTWGKDPACNAGDKRRGFDPWSGRSPGGGHGNPCSIPAWRIPWTEKPGGLRFIGSHRVGHE